MQTYQAIELKETMTINSNVNVVLVFVMYFFENQTMRTELFGIGDFQ